MTETNRTRVDEFTEPKKYTDKLTGLIFSIYIVSLPILWNICHSLLLGKELLIVCTLLFCSIIYAGTAISKSTGFSKQKFINISYADISIVLFSFILVFNSIKNRPIDFYSGRRMVCHISGLSSDAEYTMCRHNTGDTYSQRNDAIGNSLIPKNRIYEE